MRSLTFDQVPRSLPSTSSMTILGASKIHNWSYIKYYEAKVTETTLITDSEESIGILNDRGRLKVHNRDAWIARRIYGT